MNSANLKKIQIMSLMLTVICLVTFIGAEFARPQTTSKPNTVWMKNYCTKKTKREKRSKRGKKHNQCCRSQKDRCYTACWKKYGNVKGRAESDCIDRCDEAKEQCFRTLSKPKNKPFKGLWMYKMCERKHGRISSHNRCCDKNETACLNVCDGYPRADREKCRKRYNTAETICKRSKPPKGKFRSGVKFLKWCKSLRAGPIVRNRCCREHVDSCFQECDKKSKRKRGACKKQCGKDFDRCYQHRE